MSWNHRPALRNLMEQCRQLISSRKFILSALPAFVLLKSTCFGINVEQFNTNKQLVWWPIGIIHPPSIKNPGSAPLNIQDHTWRVTWNSKGKGILEAKPLKEKYKPNFEFPEGRSRGF